MTRQIKFKRVHFLDKECTKCYHVDIWGARIGKTNFTSPSTNNVTDYYIDFQFTGLLDKNGKEIFEGDVLRWDNGGFFAKGVIEWHENGFWIETTSDEMFLPRDCEIIGDIYQNPELLNK